MMIEKLFSSVINFLFLFLIFSCEVLSQTQEHRFIIKSGNEFDLYFEGNFIKTTNIFDTTLNSGIYLVEAYSVDPLFNQKIFKRKIDLQSDRLIDLNCSFDIFINTQPQDAEVYIDSLFCGFTPLKLKLMFNPQFLQLKLTGYKETIINLANEFYFNKEIVLESLGKETRRSFNKYKYIALTSMIVNGILSTYYKQLANKYFYKKDKDQTDYQKIRKYDNYSAVFTIGMEISFSIFVYSLFQE